MKLPQLSLRDLFWLVALVAMGCGWWVQDTRIADRLNEAEAELEITKALLNVERKQNEQLRGHVAHLTMQIAKPGTLHSYRTQP